MTSGCKRGETKENKYREKRAKKEPEICKGVRMKMTPAENEAYRMIARTEPRYNGRSMHPIIPNNERWMLRNGLNFVHLSGECETQVKKCAYFGRREQAEKLQKRWPEYSIVPYSQVFNISELSI